MSTSVVNDSPYTQQFRLLRELEGDSLSWLKILRENAFAEFERQGIPNVDIEDWKYTNTAAIQRLEPKFDSAPVADDERRLRITAALVDEPNAIRLVFINGVLDQQLSSYAKVPGLVVTGIDEALRSEEHALALREYLGRVVDYSENGFVALNTALFSNGAFVWLKAGVNVESPIILEFVTDGPADGQTVLPRIFVLAERDSSATLVETYIRTSESGYFTNSVVEIVLKENARLRHAKVQRESKNAFHIASTAASVGRTAHWDSTTITLGAALSRHGIRASLQNEGAECNVDGLYVVGDGQHADTHSLIEHLVPNCSSHQLYKGILDGKSRAVFNGKVFVHKGAHGTDALQTNRNLLLSNEARVDTKPQLEIFNEDVKCAHGATVGQLEDEEVFYLESRGLHPELAKSLLTYGFAGEVIEKVGLESIKSRLEEAVLNRLHARLET
jgi:Fe-S cluster assembly protein SufD